MKPRCIRDSRGRFAKHTWDIGRKCDEGKKYCCIRCGYIHIVTWAEMYFDRVLRQFAMPQLVHRRFSGRQGGVVRFKRYG